MRVSPIATNYQSQNTSQKKNPNFTAKLNGVTGEIKEIFAKPELKADVLKLLNAVDKLSYIDEIVISLSRSTKKILGGLLGKAEIYEWALRTKEGKMITKQSGYKSKEGVFKTFTKFAPNHIDSFGNELNTSVELATLQKKVCR